MNIFRVRNNQAGSIKTYMVIGVVLALVLIGAIFFLNNRGEQARKDQTVSTTDEKKQTENKTEDKKTEEPKKTDNSDIPSYTTEPVKKTEEKTTPVENTAQATTSEALPTTGPTDDFVQFVAVFALTVAIASYVSSRRIFIA